MTLAVVETDGFVSADGAASRWRVIRFAIVGAQGEMLVGAIAILISNSA